MLDSGVYDKFKLVYTIEGILYCLRTGCPWRDLTPQFGPWYTIYKRFNDWSGKGKLRPLFKRVFTDLEWEFIHGSLFKVR